MTTLRHIIALLIFPAIVLAQDNIPPVESGTIESLAALLDSINTKNDEVVKAQEAIKLATDAPTRNSLEENLQQLQNEHEALKKKFADIAIGTDASIFSIETREAFNIQAEIEKLARPIFAEINNATADSRLIEELRSELGNLRKREEVANTAVNNLESVVAANTNSNLNSKLDAELNLWINRRNDARNKATAVEYQLGVKLREHESFFDNSRDFFTLFFQGRGLNLFLGIGTFCLVFFGLRFVYFVYRKIRPLSEVRTFGSRLGTLVFHLFTILASIFSIVFIFNLRGDWFLLGLTLIFLIGVGWGGLNTIPVFFEQLKLMLNFGAVKEKERIIFQGVPWEVESLSMYARLVNPLLDGGVQDLPIRTLVGMHSRKTGEHEEWFPSRKNDWVELADGRIGKVTYQTPEFVQLTQLGGAQILYQTPLYLAQNPRNMSTNYRIKTRFGIDYQHQAIATTEIPEKMRIKLESGLLDLVPADQIMSLRVQFTEASASSLDYEVIADLDGSTADQHENITRAISRLLVDACNENGWIIPFTQVTLHQAESHG